MTDLYLFQLESNNIEGINTVKNAEIDALEAFIANKYLTIDNLVDYIKVIQPDALLRDNIGIPGVQVGNHVALASGQYLMSRLSELLDEVNNGRIKAYDAYCRYEYLHPFTDGNGRSGRAVWLWLHKGKAPVGFLREFHYEALAFHDRTLRLG